MCMYKIQMSHYLKQLIYVKELLETYFPKEKNAFLNKYIFVSTIPNIYI